jgi:nucleotide-binding universal stress UspA family protein
MTIVCGTDFSERCNETATLAATLARRMDQALELVHSLDTRGVLFNVGAVLATIEGAAQARLDAEAARLRALGATVEPVLTQGWPDEGVLDAIERSGADLVVLSALGRREPGRTPLGKTCERVVSASRAPVLVARNPEPLAQWAEAAAPLRVLCGFDIDETAQAALARALRLRAIAPCEIVAAYVDDPAGESARLGMSVKGSAEDVQRVVENELRDRLHRIAGADQVRLVVSPHLGDPAARLAHLAEREQAQLVVVGTHGRTAGQRLLHGSVSLDLLRHSAANVLVVPTDAAPALARAPGSPQRVLVATDLSPQGNRAVAMAFPLLPADCRVRLLTVVHPLRMPTAPFGRAIDDPEMQQRFEVWREQCRRDLEALVPTDAAVRRVSVEVEVHTHDDPAEAIRQCAERIDADLICMGTAGRTGLAATLMGSVAQAVLRHGHRPVLMIPASALG